MKKLGIVLCVFWIGFIFYNSSQPATISGGVTDNIVSYIKEVVKGKNDVSHNDISYNDVKSSFKDVVKSIIASKKRKKISWENTPTTSKVNNFIRKMAHGLEFFVLSILVIFIFSRGKINNVDLVIRTLFIVVMCAVLDEYLQGYIPGRGSLVSDVLIDFWGGCFGILVFKGLSKLKGKEKKEVKQKRLKVG